MAENMFDVMVDAGTALDTITGLRVYDFPPTQPVPPFAFVDMPETLVYDLTYKRGSDRFTIMVHVGVAKLVDRAMWKQLSAYVSSSDPKSVKNALELGHPNWRVTQATFSTITLSGVDYAGISFTLDVAA